MEDSIKPGIIICDRYRTCNGCLGGNMEVEVVVGIHPIPKKYLDMHSHLGTWQEPV